jgi:hypothetical protein
MKRLLSDYRDFRRLADQPPLLALRNAVASALGWMIKAN